MDFNTLTTVYGVYAVVALICILFARRRNEDWWGDTWGVNAWKGHLVMFATGSMLSGADIWGFHNIPGANLLGLLSAFVVFPPLLLPARGICPVEERKQMFVLTFATSSIFGIFGGVLVHASLARKVFHLTLDSADGSISTIYTLAAAFAVGISYWTVGYMSRDLQRQIKDSCGHFPPKVNRLIGILETPPFSYPTLADQVIKALMAYDIETVLELWPKVEKWVFKKICNSDEKQRIWLQELLEEAKVIIHNWPNEIGEPVDVLTMPPPTQSHIVAEVTVQDDYYLAA